jgi:hypothetical protein
MSAFQPTTGQGCTCKPGVQRDNCPACEGTGLRVDFAAIRAARMTPPAARDMLARLRAGERLPCVHARPEVMPREAPRCRLPASHVVELVPKGDPSAAPTYAYICAAHARRF